MSDIREIAERLMELEKTACSGDWSTQPCLHGGLLLKRGEWGTHPQPSIQILTEEDARLIAESRNHIAQLCRVVLAALELQGALSEIEQDYIDHREDTAEVCFDWCLKCKAQKALAAFRVACEGKP